MPLQPEQSGRIGEGGGKDAITLPERAAEAVAAGFPAQLAALADYARTRSG